MKPATLLLYTKPPRIGLSKTRLAAGLGRAGARRIAHFTLARTLRAAMANDGWRTRSYIAPDSEIRDRPIASLWPPHLPLISQGAGDLGARLAKGLKEAPPGPVLFIGADAPDVSASLLRSAVRKLRRNDAIFGPASDGGFWAFGLNKTARSRVSFSGVRWSGPHAMEDVWANLPPGAKVAILPTLIDIDTVDDWAAWRQSGR